MVIRKGCEYNHDHDDYIHTTIYSKYFELLIANIYSYLYKYWIEILNFNSSSEENISSNLKFNFESEIQDKFKLKGSLTHTSKIDNDVCIEIGKIGKMGIHHEHDSFLIYNIEKNLFFIQIGCDARFYYDMNAGFHNTRNFVETLKQCNLEEYDIQTIVNLLSVLGLSNSTGYANLIERDIRDIRIYKNYVSADIDDINDINDINDLQKANISYMANVYADFMRENGYKYTFHLNIMNYVISADKYGSFQSVNFKIAPLPSFSPGGGSVNTLISHTSTAGKEQLKFLINSSGDFKIIMANNDIGDEVVTQNEMLIGWKGAYLNVDSNGNAILSDVLPLQLHLQPPPPSVTTVKKKSCSVFSCCSSDSSVDIKEEFHDIRRGGFISNFNSIEMQEIARKNALNNTAKVYQNNNVYKVYNVPCLVKLALNNSITSNTYTKIAQSAHTQFGTNKEFCKFRAEKATVMNIWRYRPFFKCASSGCQNIGLYYLNFKPDSKDAWNAQEQKQKQLLFCLECSLVSKTSSHIPLSEMVHMTDELYTAISPISPTKIIYSKNKIVIADGPFDPNNRTCECPGIYYFSMKEFVAQYAFANAELFEQKE